MDDLTQAMASTSVSVPQPSAETPSLTFAPQPNCMLFQKLPGELRNEIKTLQADNLGLYEKVRYLQSYGPAGSGATGGRGDAVIQIGTGNGASGRRDASGAYPPPRSDDKYRARYEESMNPFEAFRGREQGDVRDPRRPPRAADRLDGEGDEPLAA